MSTAPKLGCEPGTDDFEFNALAITLPWFVSQHGRRGYALLTITDKNEIAVQYFHGLIMVIRKLISHGKYPLETISQY